MICVEVCENSEIFHGTSCYVVDGRFNVYETASENHTEIRANSLRATAEIMDEGVLNSSHPALVSITFVGEDKNVSIPGDDKNERDGALILMAFSSIPWGLLFTSVSSFIFVVALTRYRYYSTKQEMDDVTNHNVSDTESGSG